MRDRRGNPDRRPSRWSPAASALVAALALLTTPALAGPKGMIVVRPLGNLTINIDGSLSDWPLDKFAKVAEQPVFPQVQEESSTSAMGDHLVFDKTRIGRFNSTPDDAFPDFGASMYFAYDAKYLYILGVVIKGSPLRDDLDTSDCGSTGYLNDGFEFFLDTKGDSTGCMSNDAFPAIDESAPYTDDFQVTVALNKTFKPNGSAADVLGARQSVERAGNLALIGDNKGCAGGIYRDALDAGGGPDIAARRFDDLKAAGARNPEILANPNTKFAGYVIEMRVPFSPKIPAFTPDHNMGFEIFWREVDSSDTISWASWAQSTTVDCGDLKTSLFNTSNWGALVFDKTDFLGPTP
jgi:hypothetical protein